MIISWVNLYFQIDKEIAMKKYEYKYLKTEAKLMTAGTQKAFDDDEAMLTGYGLEGWRVNSLVGSYYLMEREVEDQES